MTTKILIASLLLVLGLPSLAQTQVGQAGARQLNQTEQNRTQLKSARELVNKSNLDQISPENLADLLGIELSLKTTLADPLTGRTVQRLQQTHNGIDLLGAEVILAIGSGKIESIAGEVAQLSLLTSSPALTAAQALTQAQTAAVQLLAPTTGKMKYRWEIDPSVSRPAARLIYWARYPEAGQLDYKLAYEVDLEIAEPLNYYRIYIDAASGALLESVDRISTVTGAEIPGATLYDGVQNIDVEQLPGGEYVLRDFSRPAEIRTFSADNDGLFSTSSSITDPDAFFDSDSAGVAVHWASQLAFDYFLGQGMVSYDNDGGPINSWVHFETNLANAFYYPGQGFYYGDGASNNPFVSLDVVGHEYTHAISEYSAKLTLKRESGALLESFCDIFGEVLEKEARGVNDWKLGDCLIAGGIRDMSDPTLLNHPSFYQGPNWIAAEAACLPNVNDNCGVHSNCGVQNFWFYLLSEGGAGTNFAGYNYDVSGIGIDAAAKIAFITLTQKLSYFSDYFDAAEGSIEATQDLIASGFFTDSASVMDAVVEAWCAVGLGPCNFNNSSLLLENLAADQPYYAGQTIELDWQSAGSVDSAMLEYSINGGAYWSPIAADLTDSNFNWTLPDVSSKQVLVRVRSQEFEQIRDEIDSSISINGCELTADFSEALTNIYCTGDTVTFDAAQSQTGAIQYRWYLNGDLWGISQQLSINLSGGPIEIELRVSDSLCLKSSTRSFDLNEAAAGFEYIVIYNEVELLAPLSDTYSWDIGGLASSNTRLTTSMLPFDTTVNVCLTTTNLCGMVTNCELVATTSPLSACAGNAAFSIDSSICQNNAYQISPNTIPPTGFFRWTIDGDLESFDNSYDLNTTAPGIKTVLVDYLTAPGGCIDTYGKFVVINKAASSIDITDLLSCDTPSITLEADPTLTYNWSYEGSIISTSPQTSINAFGNYTVQITDACSQMTTDTFQSTRDNSCVYPGDLNFDGVVNNADLLPLGTYFGLAGPTRPNASTNWVPQSSPLWIPDTVDFGIRHIDANGDGLIDLRDREPIIANFGQSHDLSSPSPISGGSANLVPEVSALNDSTLAIDIQLTATSGLVTAYGTAFSLSIPAGQFGGISNVSSNLDNSWLGSPNELIELLVNEDSVLAVGGETIVNTFYGVTRIDQANRIGVDDVVKLILDIDADLPGTGGDSSLIIAFNDAQVVNNLGDFVPVNFNAASSTYGFTLDENCGRPINLSNLVTPALITLSWDEVDDASGYLVRGRKFGSTTWASRIIFPAMNQLQLPATALDPGTYEWHVQAGCINAGDLAISDTSQTATFVTAPISRLSDLEFQIFPNPVVDFVQLRQTGKYEHFRIIDLLGKVWKTGHLEGEYTTIDVTELPNGSYFIEIGRHESTNTQSFTINRN